MFKNIFSFFDRGRRRGRSNSILPLNGDSRRGAHLGDHNDSSHPEPRPTGESASFASTSQPETTGAAQNGGSDAASIPSSLTPSERRTRYRQRIVWWLAITTTQILFVDTTTALILTIVRWKTAQNLPFLIWFVISAAFLIAAGTFLYCVGSRRRERRDIELSTVKQEGEKWYQTAREKEKISQRVGLAAAQLRAGIAAGSTGVPVGDEVGRVLDQQGWAAHQVFDGDIQRAELPEDRGDAQITLLVPSGPIHEQKWPVQWPGYSTDGISGPLTKPPTYASRQSTETNNATPQDLRFSASVQSSGSPTNRDSSCICNGHARGSYGIGPPVPCAQCSHMARTDQSPSQTEPSQYQNPDSNPTIPQPPWSNYPYLPGASALERDIFQALNASSPNHSPREHAQQVRSPSLIGLASQSIPALTLLPEQDAGPVELPTSLHHSAASSSTSSQYRMRLSALEIPERSSSLRKWNESVLVPAFEPGGRGCFDGRLGASKSSPSLGRVGVPDRSGETDDDAG